MTPTFDGSNPSTVATNIKYKKGEATMKRIYESLNIEVVGICSEDVISTSNYTDIPAADGADGRYEL